MSCSGSFKGPHIKLSQVSAHFIKDSEKLIMLPQWFMCMGLATQQHIEGRQGAVATATSPIIFIPNKHAAIMTAILGVNRCIVVVITDEF